MTRILTTHGLRLDVGDAELHDLKSQGLIAEIEPKKKSKPKTEPKAPETASSTEAPTGAPEDADPSETPGAVDPEGGN